jgi:dynein light intermediate chain 1
MNAGLGFWDYVTLEVNQQSTVGALENRRSCATTPKIIMATTFSQPGSSHIATPSKRNIDRPSKRKEKRTDIWTSLLRQTRQAQARNRNNAVAHRQIVVCGGSPDDQRQFLSSIARPPPPAPPSRNRDQRDQKPKGQLNLSNRYAYGYGHMSLYSSPQVGTGGASFGQEAEEAAKLEAHTIAEPEAAYEPVLRRLLAPRAEEASEEQDEDDEDMLGAEIVKDEGRRPAVAILLSWREPWTFLSKLREWLQLLAKAVEPNARPEEDIMELLKESKLAISLVVQHVEAQQDLERDGWQEETFDFVAQALRTSLLPLHPLTSLLFTSSSTPPQQPGSSLTEAQKTVYQSLDLDLATLGPKATAGGASAKAEDLLPRHNVVDRMNIVVPQGWDSAGKIRLLSEDFSPEEVLAAWQEDLSHPVIEFSSTAETIEAEITPTDDTNAASGAAGEEIYASAVSPIEGENDIPSSSPSDSTPSAIRSYETQIQDPNAHKRPKPPTITVTTRSEQEFLKEMRMELDNLIARDRERGDVHRTPAGNASGRGVGMPSGESTGALNELGDVSFNVGGVSYNTVSAEAAIERLKRPAQPQLSQQSQQQQATDGAVSGSPRAGTPRQPRREDREVATPTSGKSDFPSEDLEKYFASLAKKAGGAESSRAGTPSKQ